MTHRFVSVDDPAIEPGNQILFTGAMISIFFIQMTSILHLIINH